MRRQKSQSAMEYLMTYGWAILIIAVVLGVLFQLGVFSGSALSPKAQPGSCQVQRLLGQVSLEGQCTGLLPQFVAQFNGASGYIDTGNPSILELSGSITISAWVYLNACQSSSQGAIVAHGSNSYTFYVGVCNLNWAKGGVANTGAGVTIPTKIWLHVVAVNNAGSNVYFYVNGTQNGPYSFSYSYSYAQNLRIGSSQPDTGGFLFYGAISDVQIYNTSLSANEVKALYLEGIGGTPIRLQNLVAWWPLNGNAQDYSGNNNNGQIIGGVSFNGTWGSAYTPP